MRLPTLLILISTTLPGCGERPNTAEDYYLTPVKLPDGTIIKAEQARTPEEMLRGMMFRDELKPDRGMLFSHGSVGRFPYWMYQVKLPLDIIWVNQARRIVEISAQTPPCPPGPASKCPQYGGHEDALFVVELAAGVAARHGLKVGDPIAF